MPTVSDLWYVFEKIDEGRARCVICENIYSYKSTTTNLWSHLKKRHAAVRISSDSPVDFVGYHPPTLEHNTAIPERQANKLETADCTVRWYRHNSNVNEFLTTNYANEKYTDVTIACEGHILKAHKMILAGCSVYFETLFNTYDAKMHPYGQPLCVVLDGMGIDYSTLLLILDFIYGGEITVKKSELEAVIDAGEKLKVRGMVAFKLNDTQPERRTEATTSRMAKRASTSGASVPASDLSLQERMTVHQTPSSNRLTSPSPEVDVLLSTQSLKVEPDDIDYAFEEKLDPHWVGQIRHEDNERVFSPNIRQPKEEPTSPSERARSRSTSRSPVEMPMVDPEPPASPDAAIREPEQPLTESDAFNSQLNVDDAELEADEDGDDNEEAAIELVSKRRIIRKPARLLGNDFIPILIPSVKKRKLQESPSKRRLTEENAEPNRAEERADLENKRQKGAPFYKFCHEFRKKLEAENTGESFNEITNRLTNMWKNLDGSEKERFAQPSQASLH